ncbi:MAG: hypothetical protein JO038_07035 [Alphaproteobacteria bacterium]|nr:hypothetical protein [Alphaproteobacteria bacterium]
MDKGVQLLELARNAERLFAKQEPLEKRRLLNFLLSNCAWEDGEVVAIFRPLFDLLAEPPLAHRALQPLRPQKRPKVRIGWGTRIRT